MKISTILMGAAIALCGTTALAAEENLMRNATEGATGNVEGLDAPLVQDGWQLWNCPYSYDSFEDMYSWDKGYADALAEQGYSEEEIEEKMASYDPVNNTESWPGNVRLEPANKWNTTTEEGDTYSGTVAMFRWDGGGDHYRWFCYPVEMKKGLYEFSCLAGDFNNLNLDSSSNCYVHINGFRVAISPKVGPAYLAYAEDQDVEEADAQAGVLMENFGKLFEIGDGGGENCVLHKFTTLLAAPEDGTYYISITGPHTIQLYTEFSLKYEAAYEGPNPFVENGDNAVNEIAADNAPVEYFNLQGVRVAEPSNGIFIVKKGNKTTKRVIR